MENKTFQNAFNSGYLLEKYVPALTKLLVPVLSKSQGAYSEGFIAGSKQYVDEQAKTQSKFKSKAQDVAKGQTKQEKPKDNKDLDRQK